MMQLCQGARHIEVQIVGDEHGNAVALSLGHLIRMILGWLEVSLKLVG